jgi:hypothetical protein
MVHWGGCEKLGFEGVSCKFEAASAQHKAKQLACSSSIPTSRSSLSGTTLLPSPSETAPAAAAAGCGVAAAGCGPWAAGSVGG